MCPGGGVPNVPDTPRPVAPLSVLFPPIHAHWLVEGSYSQRSLREPYLPTESAPSPPKSQRLPLLSVQLTADERFPGMFFAAGLPNVPYTLGSGVFVPFIQAHSFVCPLAAQHRKPNVSTASAARDLFLRILRKAFVVVPNNPPTFGENNS